MTDVQDWLDRGRALADQATQGPWEVEESSDGWTEIYGRDPIEPITPTVATTERGGNTEATFIADARTRLPQALNALQAVHDLHQPVEFFGCAQGCPEWPCPTVRAIQTELEQKETQA